MLREYIDSGRLQESVANKLREWFETGLQDWDISRDAPYWGFEIPDAPGKYFYVWLDAPIGYQASYLRWCNENGGDFDAAWSLDSEIELYHFIGKDISYFHNLFWPAMLDGAGMRKPTAVFVHGFLKVDGLKMSKSRGTFINARTYLDHLPAEALRFYFAAKLNSRVEDIDLALKDFVFRVNSDLVNKVINIASRCGGPLFKQYVGQLADSLHDEAAYAEVLAARDEIAALYEAREYGAVVRKVAAMADVANVYINDQAPWVLMKSEETYEQGRLVCTQGINLFRALITYLAPIVPKITEDAMAWMQTELSWEGIDAPLLGTTLPKYQALMFRIDNKAVNKMVEASRPADAPAEPEKKAKKKSKKKGPPPPPAEISYDQFMSVEIRIGKVLEAAPVEGADSLLALTVDIGGDKPRNIFAGIKAAYPPEELVGRLVLVAANLAPRKMRFGVSEGMVLAAGDGRPYLVSPDDGAQVGDRVR
jgi:methionyl-tRNA synthetase